MTNQAERAKLLHLIDAASFAVVELSLFLDTHPDDREAMKNFAHYKELRENALRTYADSYGPLTIDTAKPADHWYWSTEPWPWEGGCY